MAMIHTLEGICNKMMVIMILISARSPTILRCQRLDSNPCYVAVP